MSQRPLNYQQCEIFSREFQEFFEKLRYFKKSTKTKKNQVYGLLIVVAKIWVRN